MVRDFFAISSIHDHIFFYKFVKFPLAIRGVKRFGMACAHAAVMNVTFPLSKTAASPQAKYRAGFTLVEILVVILIIIILAALAFMFTSSAKDKALKVNEMANLRSVSAIVMVYHSDKNILPGPVNRGIMVPSKVTTRKNYLSTFLIDAGYLGEGDALWTTKRTAAADAPSITYVLNSSVSTTPIFWFGSIQSSAPPKTIAALRANRNVSAGGDGMDQDLTQLWMISTADADNYGASPLIPQPLPAGTGSAWNGRFYSYFDGRVEFIKKQTPSIYPAAN